VRTVLLKQLDERGFSFFTNYESRKGHELQRHPRAALSFSGPPSSAKSACVGVVQDLPRAKPSATSPCGPTATESSLGVRAK